MYSHNEQQNSTNVPNIPNTPNIPNIPNTKNIICYSVYCHSVMTYAIPTPTLLSISALTMVGYLPSLFLTLL